MSRSSYLPFGAPNISEAEIAAVTRVLRSGWIGMGAETAAFEEELARFMGAPHVVTLNSCTSALFLSLLVNRIEPGDEVICPSLTWCSTANAALYLGASPVFCDVDRDTLCATPDSISRAVSKRTRAVIVVHFGGLPAEVTKIRSVLPSSIAVVEDAAHALGARFGDGNPVGSSGNAACFSFYANKNLSTAEGGAIALSDESAASRLRSLRQHGLSIDAWKRFTHSNALLVSAPLEELGYKMNYTDLQAALGRAQLARQAEFSERRLAVARRYSEFLSDLDQDIRLQDGLRDARHARHLFVIQLPVEKLQITRNEFILKLRERNIGASVHYAPLHEMPLYRRDMKPETLVTTEDLARRIVTLPIGANMTETDTADVIDAFGHVYRAALRSRDYAR